MTSNLKAAVLSGAMLTTAFALGACDSQPPATGGAALFKKKCATCHSLNSGKHGVGPSLAGIIGRNAGSTSFTKYKALRDADFVWTEENLDAWIANPKAFIKKPTAMTVKVKNKEEREAIIEFLGGKED